MASSGSSFSTVAVEEKSSSHSYAASSNIFFTSKEFLTLKALASIEFINRLGSVELVEEDIKNNPLVGLCVSPR